MFQMGPVPPSLFLIENPQISDGCQDNSGDLAVPAWNLSHWIPKCFIS